MEHYSVTAATGGHVAGTYREVFTVVPGNNILEALDNVNKFFGMEPKDIVICDLIDPDAPPADVADKAPDRDEVEYQISIRHDLTESQKKAIVEGWRTLVPEDVDQYCKARWPSEAADWFIRELVEVDPMFDTSKGVKA